MIRILVGFVDESHKNVMHTLVNGCGREGVFDIIYQLCKGAMKLECVVVSDGAKKKKRNTLTASHARASALCGNAFPVSTGKRTPTESPEP